MNPRRDHPPPASAPEDERRRLLARVHCLKAELGWSDETYRERLQSLTGARSAAGLSVTALRMLAEDFAAIARDRQPMRVPGGEWGFIARAPSEKQPLLRKIVAVCRALGVGRRYAEGVAKRQAGGLERHLPMMAYDELYRVAQALTTTQRSKAAVAGEGQS